MLAHAHAKPTASGCEGLLQQLNACVEGHAGNPLAAKQVNTLGVFMCIPVRNLQTQATCCSQQGMTSSSTYHLSTHQQMICFHLGKQTPPSPYAKELRVAQ